MRTENYIIAVANAEGTKYMGFTSKGELKNFESPLSVRIAFGHDDATNIVRAMRKSGKLAEGETVRVKTLAQSMRDYCWEQIQKSKDETVMAGTNKVESVLAMYPAPAKAETTKEEVAEVETEAPIAEVGDMPEEIADETSEVEVVAA